MTLFKGSGVAIVTPYTDEGINYEELSRMIDWHISEGTDAIIICGTTGEPATMSENEYKTVIKFTIDKTAGRIPVIAGTGSNSTSHAISNSKYAEEVGADGLLLVTPYYNKATQKGLVDHFTAIADSVNIPIILYNVPGRTGVNMLPKTVETLSMHRNICGIKEASGDLAQVTETARLTGDDFGIYTGNDDVIIPTMSLGGFGVISVVANILPADTHNLVKYYLDGDHKSALNLQLKMKALIDALFIEVNPIPVKTAMGLMGMDSGKLRLPLTNMSEENLEILKNEMINYGLLNKEAVNG